MNITLQTSQHVAADLHRRRATRRESEELLRTAEELGIQLVPIHPDTADPELASFFSAQVPDRPAAVAAIERLRRLSAVSAAYVKPAGSPPGAGTRA